MGKVQIGTKSVGSIVRIRIDGVLKDFIVVQQGKPSSLYAASCDGTWLLLKDCLETRAWNSSISNSYKASTIHSYLNSTWLAKLDANIQAQVKKVKLPYVNGTGSSAVASGTSGLEAQIFLLSGYEVGFTQSVNSYFPVDGARLDYFQDGNGNAAGNIRIAYYNGSATIWWLRSPWTRGTGDALCINTAGGCSNIYCTNTYGIRPALVLPSDLLVSDDGSVIANTAPAITSPTASGTNLGVLTEGFSMTYSVSDEDGDAVTAREYLDNTLTRTHAPALGETCAFQAVAPERWQTVLNGSHTLKVVANDGMLDSAAHTVTFEKKVTSAGVTLTEPLDADDRIRVAVVTVAGEIPEDAALAVLVTNNARDDAPVWEDATADVLAGENHVFKNQTAAKGFAFNFKLSVSRGPSGQGGHISSIGGAFE